MSRLRTSAVLGCFFRSYLVTAAYNPRGLHNIGFLFAIEPALAALHGPGKELREARLRYVRNYNCHPFLTPTVLGLFLHMEEAIAEGKLNPALHKNLKDTTANTLSAIGDSFFNGTMLSTWGIFACCLVLAGLPMVALALTATAFVLLQLFKFFSFLMALRKGMAVLFLLRRLDLINWGDRFKYANALFLTMLLWLALPDASLLSLGTGTMYLLLASWLVAKLHMPRVILALSLLAAMAAARAYNLFEFLPMP